MSTLTPIFRLKLIAFDQQPWDVDMNDNISTIDAVMARYLAFSNIVGVWVNSTVYTAGQQVIDSVDSSLWICSVGNTSAASPTTFAADRIANPTFWVVSATQSTVYLRGWIAGLFMIPTTVAVTVASGNAMDSNNTTMINLASSMAKTTAGVWVAGGGNAGMGTSLTIANNTWYHVFLALINGVADIFFDTSVTAAHKPTGTSVFRRIGSFFTNGSAQIIPTVQNGDEFLWSAAFGDVAVANLGTTPTLYTLTIPPDVKVNALIRASIGVTNAILIGSPDETTLVSGTPTGNNSLVNNAGGNAGHFNIRSNTTKQIKAVASGASTTFNVVTFGWIDSRGKNA